MPPGEPGRAGGCERLEAWVDAHHDEQVAFLREVVKVPTDTPPGDNAPAAQRTAELLEAMGLRVERHPVPDAFLQEYGMKSVTNLIVRQRLGDGGPTIALNAHGDVVPPGDGWTRDPYGGVVEDGRMYGRGVAVSKSDIATYAYAIAALRDAAAGGASLRGTLELHVTYDEEYGGLAGPGWLLQQGLTRPDYALAASFSYAVITAHSGCLQFEVTVHGKSAHGSMPETGRDALQAAVAILDAIYAQVPGFAALRSRVPGIDHPTTVVGLISGGINTNVVPDRIVFRMDRRMIPEEDPASVEAALRTLIAGAVAGREGIRVDVRRTLLARALRPLPGHRAAGGAAAAPRGAHLRRADRGARRAAVLGRPAVRRGGRADRHVRRGAANDPRGQRQEARREPAARGPAPRDAGRCLRAVRPAVERRRSLSPPWLSAATGLPAAGAEPTASRRRRRARAAARRARRAAARPAGCPSAGRARRSLPAR